MAVRNDVGTNQFKVRVEHQGATCIVRLFGEFDLATLDQAKEALRQAEETDGEKILVDLNGLRFIDSHGLALLIEESRRSDGAGRLRFTRGSGHVAEMLRLTGLDQTLPFES